MVSSRLSVLADALSARLTRRAALAGVPAALVPAARTGAQDGTPAGMPTPGSNAFEFVGVIQQLGLDFSLLGYVTHIAGIDSALLFDGADPLSRSESTARLLMVGNAAGVSRSILENIFVVNGEGTVDFYLGGPGASFGDASSFTSGTLVTSTTVRVQDVINVQAPQQGIATGNGTMAVATTEPFTLGESTQAIGAPGTTWRIEFTGQGTLRDPATLDAFVLVAGNGVLAG